MVAALPLVISLLGAGDDALVIDGASPLFLRFSEGTWKVAPSDFRGAPSLVPSVE